jgi:hypothetical protein
MVSVTVGDRHCRLLQSQPRDSALALFSSLHSATAGRKRRCDEPGYAKGALASVTLAVMNLLITFWSPDEGTIPNLSRERAMKCELDRTIRASAKN